MLILFIYFQNIIYLVLREIVINEYILKPHLGDIHFN